MAYIIKSKPLLYQFLYDGNALTILLNIILSANQDEFTAEAVDALTCMSRYTLGIHVPELETNKAASKYDEYNVDEDAGQPLCENCDMRFIVHERTTKPNSSNGESKLQQSMELSTPPVIVAFNKALLCATSEVFNTMLNSDFREGKEGDIHLDSYSVAGLRYFLNLIVKMSLHSKMNIPPAKHYAALLEAFEMSRLYIIPEMEEFVQQILIYQLDETNCLNVLEWSMKNYHVELTEMAINYYLSSALSCEAKVQLFRTADYSTYSAEWFQMIFDAVFARCRSVF